jgi:hypothetical protein
MASKGNWFVVRVMIFGMMIIGCDNGAGTPQEYSVTIGTLTNANGCTITASPISGKDGTEITLTIISTSEYKLKVGTLKYNRLV